MDDKKIIAKCKNGETSYVSSEGRWLPCCSFPHLGPNLEKSVFSSDDYLIKNNDVFNEFHEKESFKKWLDQTESDYDSAYTVCQKRCCVTSHDINKKDADVHWTMNEMTYVRNIRHLHEYLEANDIDYNFENFIKK